MCFIFTHIPSSLSKSNFHCKGRSGIFTESVNKTNVSMRQFNTVRFQVKQFIIFEKIWGVIMNLIELNYTKINYIIRKFPRIKQLSFF